MQQLSTFEWIEVGATVWIVVSFLFWLLLPRKWDERNRLGVSLLWPFWVVLILIFLIYGFIFQ